MSGGAQVALGCWRCPSPVGDMALGHGAGVWGQVWVTRAGAGGAGRKGQSDGEELGTGQREV